MRLIDADKLKRDFNINFGSVHNAVIANRIVDAQPTVDENHVSHGDWINADDGDGIVCSYCGTDYCTMMKDVYADAFNYCPNCGAKMDKGE